MRKVLVADDNCDFNSKCCELLTKENYYVVSTYMGDEALNLYFSEKPDILLLDLDMPHLNGINIINTLSSVPNEINKCNIVVISGSMQLRFQLLNTSKIFKIIPKPFPFSILKNTLNEMNTYIEENVFSIENVKRLFSKMNFNIYTKGTKYLIDATELCHYNPNLLYNLSDIYNMVGKKYKTNQEIIEWSIRNSLSSMNRFVDTELLYSIFSEYDGRKISTKYFLTLLTEYFK